MELNLSPELHAQIEQWSARTGRDAGELITEAMAAYLDELGRTRDRLDTRYDNIRDGAVTLVDGEEAFSRLMEKTEAQRRRHG